MALQKSLIVFFGLVNNVFSRRGLEDHIWPRGSEPRPAKRLYMIKPRTTFYGGWALAMKPCPSGLDDHDGICCPTGTTYYQVDMGSSHIAKGYVCCPDAKISCGDAVAAIPICADTSWYLWVNEGLYPFCCLKGDIGYATSDSQFEGSLCAAGDIAVPASIRASSIGLSGFTGTATIGTATAGTAATGTEATSTATTSSQGEQTSTAIDPSSYSASGGQTNAVATDYGSGSPTSAAINPSNHAVSGGQTNAAATDYGSASSHTTSSNPIASNSTNNGSLSTAAIAGIAVGAVFVLTAIFLVIFLRRRKGTGVIPAPEIEIPEKTPPVDNRPVNHRVPVNYPPIPEVDGTGKYRTPILEVDGTGKYRNELDG